MLDDLSYRIWKYFKGGGINANKIRNKAGETAAVVASSGSSTLAEKTAIPLRKPPVHVEMVSERESYKGHGTGLTNAPSQPVPTGPSKV